jgi:AraC family transcriptional regulator, exoenzyme S synthesis regulatory protein ExsA
MDCPNWCMISGRWIRNRKLYLHGVETGILNLPQDIFPQNDGLSDSIIMHEYAAQQGAFKGKSILHKNAISLVVHGEKTMHFAEKTVVVKDDEIHFLSAGNCLASLDLSKQKIFRSILVFFDAEVLKNFYVKYDRLISPLQKKKKTVPQPYIYFKKDEFVRHYISSLSLLLNSGKKVSPEMKLLKFEELLLHLIEKDPYTVLSFQGIRKEDFDDIQLRKIMETNITTNLTITDLAFLCNLSLSTFKRRFNQLYGTSPSKWLLKKRMELAAGLLQDKKQRPGEIFHKLGYENHSSFTQSFRQVYGVTPKAWQLKNLSR